MSDKWDYLDEEYEDYVSFERIGKNTDPEGSLTDNLRIVERNRNGAHKRLRKVARQMKEYRVASE